MVIKPSGLRTSLPQRKIMKITGCQNLSSCYAIIRTKPRKKV